VATLSDDGWVGIVDDDASIRCSLARVFDAHDIPFATFSSAEEFLRRSARTGPSCMVVDVHLGGMTGFDLYERLASLGGAVCSVIFITAHDEIPAAQFHRGNGPCAFLRKPFDTEALLALVRPHVRPTSSP
jgi:FixJ family two-component response regulator